MHVLIHDASPGPGGAVTSLAAFIEILVADGHRATVCFVSASARDALVDALAGVAHDDPSRSPVGGVHRRSGAALRGVRTRLVGPRAWTSTRGATWYLREMVRASVLVGRVSRADAIDVVLANNAPGANASAWVLANTLGVPIVAWVRSAPGTGRGARHLLEVADAVFAVGDDVACSMRMPRAPVVVTEGLAPSQWPTQRRSDARRWLWAAALTPWKGADLFCEALRRVERRPGVDLCYLPLAADSRVAGALPRLPAGVRALRAPDLDAVRAGCSVFVHTSLRPEPFGRSILEAMAAGLCPVVPDEGNGPRLVTHGVDGFVVPPRDAAALASVLGELAAAPDLADRLGRAARHKAAHFTARRAFAPVLRRLEALAERPTRRRFSSLALSGT